LALRKSFNANDLTFQTVEDGFNQGTAPLGINPAGVIVGLYIDANYTRHGFVLLPQP
jgi:hypothetical protein